MPNDTKSYHDPGEYQINLESAILRFIFIYQTEIVVSKMKKTEPFDSALCLLGGGFLPGIWLDSTYKTAAPGAKSISLYRINSNMPEIMRITATICLNRVSLILKCVLWPKIVPRTNAGVNIKANLNISIVKSPVVAKTQTRQE